MRCAEVDASGVVFMCERAWDDGPAMESAPPEDGSGVDTSRFLASCDRVRVNERADMFRKLVIYINERISESEDVRMLCAKENIDKGSAHPILPTPLFRLHLLCLRYCRHFLKATIGDANVQVCCILR